MTGPARRWLLVAAVVAVAAAVALWPRGGDEPRTSPAAATPTVPGLGELRAAAALQPCPAPAPGAVPAGPLAGVVLPCLGADGPVDLGAALAGRAALLNLWGPLCRPCVEELPALQDYADSPGAVPVIGVDAQRLPEGGLDLLARLDVRYPSVSDPDGVLRAALGAAPALPLTFVVAPDGRVSQVAEVLTDPERVREVVAERLA